LGQHGSKTAQTPGKTKVWQIPESKTIQQDRLSPNLQNLLFFTDAGVLPVRPAIVVF
jgi:hypothetical protein